MNRRWSKAALVAGVVVVTVLAGTGVARAVSGGGYDADQQDCQWSAENAGAASSPTATESGCHNLALNVESGGTTDGNANSDNTRYAEVGNNQEPNMSGNPSFGALWSIGDPGTYDNPHSGCAAVNTDGTNGGTGKGCGDNPNGAGVSATYDYYQVYCPATQSLPLNSVPINQGIPAPKNCASDQPIGQTNVNPDQGTNNAVMTLLTQGLLLYFGMDDNNDNGEHDGFVPGTYTNGALNGPSDGGGITISVTPLGATNTPNGHNPEGIANGSTGFCADGICFELTTRQQTVYYGCGATNSPNNTHAACDPNTPSDGNVYQNGAPSSTQETPKCSSGDPTVPADCFTNADGSGNQNGPNGYVAQTPHRMNAQPGVQTYQDPDPQRSPAAPFGTPGLYAGTCGVYANDSGGSVGPGVTSTLTGGNVNPSPVSVPSGLC